MDRLRSYFIFLQYSLHRPTRVLSICLVVFVSTLLINGTVWKIWSLQRDTKQIETQILNAKIQVTKLQAQMSLLRNDSFIERAARDRLDYASESDLVFVFSE